MPDHMEPEITFTLKDSVDTHAAHFFQGGREYRVIVHHYSDSSMTVLTHTNHEEFKFVHSDPNVVLAIGRLLVAAARKCGARDA